MGFFTANLAEKDISPWVLQQRVLKTMQTCLLLKNYSKITSPWSWKINYLAPIEGLPSTPARVRPVNRASPAISILSCNEIKHLKDYIISHTEEKNMSEAMTNKDREKQQNNQGQ